MEVGDLISENRIVNTDEIQDIKEYILCGICYQVVTEDRVPVQCTSCQNNLFCTSCIESWKKHNETCPYCHAGDARFVPVNPILRDMIKTIRYFCKFQEKGCTKTLTFEELRMHEADCP